MQLLNTGSTTVNGIFYFFCYQWEKVLLLREKGTFQMKHQKKNISLPTDLFDYVENRVARINSEGAASGSETDFSKQIAVAVRTLKMQEESPEYGRQGNAPAPRTAAPVRIARTLEPSTDRRQPGKIK